ncbi:hypothetical protein GXW83_12530 [Streptacidiphilus sp. PB12-B1b]|uniref:contact-dependent growth inhibition system immunity protein n=1 Tax=Streptacidiphilus sp. PB12-B1b TaxID=2705012 RepID=UPI0015FB5D0B|nr:contact-dependent growth inhibition system immunity protein [Streptacidiphilus sp. PB12-B1b]QMU76442.1 hypothetical protein GXW83_12530 [Streptacidiphilus sp. PB12-B1b]
MPLPLWHSSYAALRELLEAYAGLAADDEPGRPGMARAAYLDTMRQVSPASPAVAAMQLRRLVEAGRLSAAGEQRRDAPDGADAVDTAAVALLPWPETADRAAWAQLLVALLESGGGRAASGGVPRSPWAWRRRFPQLHQLLAGYFGQDFPEEHPGLDAVGAERAALEQRRAGTDRATAARTLGQLHELAALRLDRAELETALGALGRDVELVFDPQLWLRRLAARIESAHLDG